MTALLTRPSILEVLELDSLKGKNVEGVAEVAQKLNRKLKT